jgi:hypothetical protein
MPNQRSCSVWSRREVKYDYKSVKVSYNIPSFPASRVKVDSRPQLKRVEVTLLAFKTKAKVVKFHFSPKNRSDFDFTRMEAQVRYGVLTITIPKIDRASARVPTY